MRQCRHFDDRDPRHLLALFWLRDGCRSEAGFGAGEIIGRVGIAAFIRGYLLLWLAYGLLRLAVIVAFWGAILLIIGTFAGWQWAEEVVALITG